MLFKIKYQLVGLIVFSIIVTPYTYSSEQTHQSAVKLTIAAIKTMLAKPESEINLTLAKLTIDKLIDPTINIEQTLAEINHMAAIVDSAATPQMTDYDRMQSLRTYLYSSGYWNHNRPFQYDFSDPLGQKIENKLLANYLKTRKGNCISMPWLFVILANKLKLQATIASAPQHVLVRFKDTTTNQWLNLETTDAAKIQSDDFYHSQSPMSEAAIKNGLYLAPLNKKQAIAVMLMTLNQHFYQQKQWQQSINIAKLALKHYPNYAYAMVKIANGYSHLLREKVTALNRKNIPLITEKTTLDQLYAQGEHWYRQALTLGWLPPTPESDAKYQADIKQRHQIQTSNH